MVGSASHTVDVDATMCPYTGPTVPPAGSLDTLEISWKSNEQFLDTGLHSQQLDH